MFFQEHTTPFERGTGTVAYDVLMARYMGASEKFLGDSTYGHGEVEASIAIGDKIYELTVELSREPQEDDGIYWMEMDVDPETRQMGNGSGNYPNKTTVPLTWPTLVAALCEQFELDPAVVWATGVDVQAYWSASDDDEYLKVPREADRNSYLLSVLHPLTH